jgi:hypothetical protein
MKRLQVGDQFNAVGHDNKPYTMISVTSTHYTIRQYEAEEDDEYIHKIIHDLFEGHGKPWVLNRKKIIYFNEELFKL